MRQLWRIILAASLAIQVSACSKEDPQPEVRDPIYNDLTSRAKSLDEEVKSLKEKVANLEVDLAKAEPNSISLKDVQKDLRKQRKMLLEAEQSLTYYKIRSERRRLVSRLTYKDAFAAGKDKEWPDPKEFELYQANQRLREAPRNWSTRVPRLSDRTPAAAPKEAKKPESSAEKEE